MKLFLSSVLILCFFLSLPLSAQNWTEEEQEVLDKIKQDWDSWEKAVKEKDLNIWIDNVQPADDWQGWWTSESALWTMENDKRIFDEYVKNIKNYYWENVFPLSIKIYDNLALIHFYATYTVEDKSGKSTRYEEKRFEVYRKMDGIWRLTGLMVSGDEVGYYSELEK